MRKISYGGTSGDYDSQLDASGKWTTTVPIISLDGVQDTSGMTEDSGNIRPKHRPSPRGLKDLKKPTGEDAAERLSKSLSNQGIGGGMNGRRAVSHGPNVFDRLGTSSRGGNSTSNMEKNGGLKTSRNSLMHNSSSDEYERKSGTLSKIKDLTKNLRQKTSRDEDSNPHARSNGTSVIAPRSSMSLLDGGGRRVPMSNLNKLNSPSRSSISSSNRSLHKSQDHVNLTSRSSGTTLSPNSMSSPMNSRRSTSTLGKLMCCIIFYAHTDSKSVLKNRF